MSDEAEIFYKCTEYYLPEHDRTVLWNDPEIGINWPLLNSRPLLSKKDSRASSLADAEVYP